MPANADEALEIGRQHFPEIGSPGGPSGLFVHEFDIGYLIHASWPPAADPTAPPAEPGGSNVVIAKDDGEVSFLPNFPRSRPWSSTTACATAEPPGLRQFIRQQIHQQAVRPTARAVVTSVSAHDSHRFEADLAVAADGGGVGGGRVDGQTVVAAFVDQPVGECADGVRA